MIVKYSYQLNNNKVLGDYQCESEDFKKFMKYLPKDVQCIVVELFDTPKKDYRQCWIWQRPQKIQITPFTELTVGGWKNCGIRQKK